MTTFDRFVFENTTGLTVRVQLEAPTGTGVLDEQVPGSSTETFNPNAANVQSARIVVTAPSHEPEDQTIELHGTPRRASVKALETRYNIGSIRGHVAGEY